MSDSDLLNPYDELRKQRILRKSRHAASLGIKNFNVLFPPPKAKCPSHTRKKQDSGSEFDSSDESDSDPDFFDERPNPDIKLIMPYYDRVDDMFVVPAPPPEVLTMACIYYLVFF